MRLKATLLIAVVAAFAAIGGIGHAATPSIEITTEAGSTILNAPVVPGAPFHVSGHIDGVASSDVKIEQVLVTIADGTGLASLECDDEACTSGTWVYFPHFPILPGDYTATAVVYDADGATASDEVEITIL